MKRADTNKSVWGLIPARGGSQSIPKKNLVRVMGRPLIDYVVTAAKSSLLIEKLICSTDDCEIMEYCEKADIQIDQRPKSLSRNSTRIDEVLNHFVRKIAKSGEELPAAIALLQPTSPFILGSQIDSCVRKLIGSRYWQSVQTLIDCPHNFHAFNQRVSDHQLTSFRFQVERDISYNKQKKPKHYLFGNLVITRTTALMEKNGVFATPSCGIRIPNVYGFDLDKLEDITWGEYCLREGLVQLDSPL